MKSANTFGAIAGVRSTEQSAFIYGDDSPPGESCPFSYKDIKTVYTIILYETSTSEFHKYKNICVHNFEQSSDSGLKLNLLQKYVFIPLDIFKENLQNNGIRNKLDAWLAFLSIDDPEWIIEIINHYPEFKAMYEHAYDLCLNIEKVMEMFSKELQELDRNTVLYMIDEMQEEIDKTKAQLTNSNKLLKDRDESLKIAEQRILELEQTLKGLNT